MGVCACDVMLSSVFCDNLSAMTKVGRPKGSITGPHRETVEKIQLIKSLYYRGLSLSDIGIRLGISRQAVDQLIKKSDIERRGFLDESNPAGRRSEIRVWRLPFNLKCIQCYMPIPEACYFSNARGAFCSALCYAIAQLDRLLGNIDRSALLDDCWLWTGLVNRVTGYGNLHMLGEYGSHRVAYRVFCGPIEDGKNVLHTCDTPLCCNPRHLYLGTARDNNADRDDKGRGVVFIMRPEDIAECLTSRKVLAMRQSSTASTPMQNG